jgi:HSP20 family molecular chaperone IbpA
MSKRTTVLLSVENGLLMICGERRFEIDQETTYRVESLYGKLPRSFSLPCDLDEAVIAFSAESNSGRLRLRLPKIEKKTPEPIEISAK